MKHCYFHIYQFKPANINILIINNIMNNISYLIDRVAGSNGGGDGALDPVLPTSSSPDAEPSSS